ncbi:MAG TPA: hypothetical protein VHD55_01055, partial [Candidatus Paceibacterota bacterium]|nr:hypothetical protein [Candidatus Paceibacterota bacterium]
NKKKDIEARESAKKATLPEQKDENAVRIREVITEGLGQIYFNHISRDLIQAERLTQQADEIIRKIEGHWAAGDTKKLAGLQKLAINLYKKAYEIRLMYEVDSLIKTGKSYLDASEEVIKKYEERAERINLKEEREGVYDAFRGLKFYTRGDLTKKLRPVYESLSAGKPLTVEQDKFLQDLIKEVKGAFFKGETEGHSIVNMLAKALRKVWKKEIGGTAGAAERYDIGSPAGSGYYKKGSRPRRDMYGQSGGEDDK